MPTISNVTFDELTIGQTASYSKQITEQDVILFAALSGDANPIHLDEDYARTTQFGERIAHGMLTGALVSAAIATKLPGAPAGWLLLPIFLAVTGLEAKWLQDSFMS